MKKFSSLIVLMSVAILSFSSCLWGTNIEQEESGRYLTLSSSKVFLSPNVDASRASSVSSATITVESNGDWILSVPEDADFTVSPLYGSAYVTTTVTVTPKVGNSGSSVVHLGDIPIERTDGLMSSRTLEVHQRRVPEMTTLAYFIGTNLNSYYSDNIGNMKSAVAKGDMGNSGALVIYRQSSQFVATLYELVEHEGSSYEVPLMSYTSTMSLNSGVLSSVIADVKNCLNLSDDADMNLILSSHGTGWVPPYVGVLRSVDGVDYQSIWEEKSSAESIASGVLPTRYLGCSEDGYMTIANLVSELDSSGTHFGYILFDACLMSSVEALYRLRNSADYVVASPAEVMAAGFPYSMIMSSMYTDDGTSFDVQGICEGYYNYYANYANYKYGTVAYCDLSKLEALAAEVAKLTLNELTTNQRNSLQHYEGLTTHVFYDLNNYIEVAAAEGTDLSDFTAALAAAFPVAGRLHTTMYYSGLSSGVNGDKVYYKSITSYSGVSTSQPSTLYTTQWNVEPWADAIGKTK